MKLRSVKAKARRVAGCEGKVRFTSFTRAAQVARLQSQRHGQKFRAYHCQPCGGFHSGSDGLGDPGTPADSRQPFRVFAHNGDGVECYVGRSPDREAKKMREILSQDGWTVTRVVEGRR
jgi:hypothetical protein